MAQSWGAHPAESLSGSKLGLWSSSGELWEQAGTSLGSSMSKARFAHFLLLSKCSPLTSTAVGSRV